MSQYPEHAIAHHDLLQRLIDTRNELAILYFQGEPLLINTAFQSFFGIDSLQQFARECGTIPSRFVPHDAYFHPAKAPDGSLWFEAILHHETQDRVVSMVDAQAHPHAFSVDVDTSVADYAIVTFTDISRDLIKCIMTENDADLDKESGAYDRQYFNHTADGFIDAAAFNEKIIGMTFIVLPEQHQDILGVATSIKNYIRQDDMLVRWNNDSFLLAYLTDCEHHAMRLSHKIKETVPLPAGHLRLITTVQQEHDTIESMIGRCERASHEPHSEPIVLV